MTIPILCMKNPGFQRQIKCMNRRHHSLTHFITLLFSSKFVFCSLFLPNSTIFIIFIRFFLFLDFIYFQPSFVFVFISFILISLTILFLSSIASYTFFLILISSSFFIVIRLPMLRSISFVSITFFFNFTYCCFLLHLFFASIILLFLYSVVGFF